MTIRFQTSKPDSTGNKRQMEVDFESKTVLYGFIMFRDNAIILSNKDYDKLHKELLNNGYNFKIAR